MEILEVHGADWLCELEYDTSLSLSEPQFLDLSKSWNVIYVTFQSLYGENHHVFLKCSLFFMFW